MGGANALSVDCPVVCYAGHILVAGAPSPCQVAYALGSRHACLHRAANRYEVVGLNGPKNDGFHGTGILALGSGYGCRAARLGASCASGPVNLYDVRVRRQERIALQICRARLATHAPRAPLAYGKILGALNVGDGGKGVGCVYLSMAKLHVPTRGPDVAGGAIQQIHRFVGRKVGVRGEHKAEHGRNMRRRHGRAGIPAIGAVEKGRVYVGTRCAYVLGGLTGSVVIGSRFSPHVLWIVS